MKPEAASLRGQRLRLIVIVLLFAAPVIAAWLFHASGYRSAQTTNHGQLVTPARPLIAFRLPAREGSPVTLDTLKGHWNFVTFADAACSGPCAGNLHKMRQIRLALGKDMGRVQRLLVIHGLPGQGAARLLDEHKGLLVMQGDAAFAAQFALTDAPDTYASGRIYLVDPLGNLMMSYPADAEPRGLMKDMERLLKYSKWAG
jgi:cytochrome oxidase Cu insertion factor (SCO1/SenC/PrrC family)